MPHTLEKHSVTGGPLLSPLAGKPAPKELLIDVARLEREYFERKPDVSDRNQLVAFGTSGHRGSSLHGAFNEAHILAITQAICDYRRGQGIDGPLYIWAKSDLPFFVSPDSSDVWSNPELFLPDEHRQPRFVAGVPRTISARRDGGGESRLQLGHRTRDPLSVVD